MTSVRTRVLAATLVAAASILAQPPAVRHGYIQARGGHLEGSDSPRPVSVHGMALASFPVSDPSRFWSKQVVGSLIDDWHCPLVRIALDLTPLDAFETYGRNPNLAKGRIHQVVSGALERGAYVVIAWDDDSLSLHVPEAVDFFEEMSASYGDRPNVVFSWMEGTSGRMGGWDVLRAAHLQILPAVRKYSRNLVLVGTPNFGTDASAAFNQLLPDSNVAYAQRVLTSDDPARILDIVRQARAKGATMVVGRLETGYPAVPADLTSWSRRLDSAQVAWIGWTVSPLGAAATLGPSSNLEGPWPEGELSEWGKAFRLANRSDSSASLRPDTLVVPGRWNGSWFSSIGWDHLLPAQAGHLTLFPGNWVQYRLRSRGEQRVRLSLGVQGASTGTVDVDLDGQSLGSIPVANLDSVGLAVSDSLHLAGGSHSLRLTWSTSDTGRLWVTSLQADSLSTSGLAKGREVPGVEVRRTESGMLVRVPTGLEDASVRVVDLLGRSWLDRSLPSGEWSLPLPAAAGVLFVVVRSRGSERRWTLVR